VMHDEIGNIRLASPKSPELYELAAGLTVRDYRDFVRHQDRKKIVELIRARFIHRYLTPLISIPRGGRSGFATMAICCLMVEALQSFREGLGDTRGRSKACFRNFFRDDRSFAVTPQEAETFYDHIRCGILHQAETTGGWRILRKGSAAIDPKAKTINANLFAKTLTQSLNDYCESLASSPWSDPVWKNARTKLDAICANCSANK
jgi:hypothetical protein